MSEAASPMAEDGGAEQCDVSISVDPALDGVNIELVAVCCHGLHAAAECSTENNDSSGNEDDDDDDDDDKA